MTDAKTLAEEATKPEVFNFAEAVLDRNYPEIEVPVYLDEKKVQSLVELLRERMELEIRAAKSAKPPVEVANRMSEIQTDIESLTEDLKASEYIVKIKGIAPEDHQKLDELANEKFPPVFEESTNPITGAPTKTEVENEERDNYFVATMRQAHLVSVTAPNGAVDDDFQGEENIAKVQKTFARLPYIARFKIDEAIKEATISVDFYREIANEVF